MREIGELLSLRVDPSTTCADVRAMARAKIEDIDGRGAELHRIKDVLERLARSCRGKGPTSECPILDILEEREHRADG